MDSRHSTGVLKLFTENTKTKGLYARLLGNILIAGHPWVSIESIWYFIHGAAIKALGKQEPGTNEEIQVFCKETYDITFPVLSKIEVNGDKTDPVYKYLKSKKSGLLGFTKIK